VVGAARVGAAVWVVDARATPDWVVREGLPEPRDHEYEELSWRLAAALVNRWPKSLGRIVELHGAGGFYDQIQLQSISDLTLGPQSPRPRVSLNRPGSLWVFAQTGETRWTWREIWNHLAHGGDPDEAARIVGAIAGFRAGESRAGPGFADMACAFLDAAPEPLWSWRCAWADGGEPSPWVERYRGPLARYNRRPSDNKLPTVATDMGCHSRRRGRGDRGSREPPHLGMGLRQASGDDRREPDSTNADGGIDRARLSQHHRYGFLAFLQRLSSSRGWRMLTVMRVAIYTRLSSDPTGQQTATERQARACEQFAAARDWDVVRVIEDVDVSAYNLLRDVRETQAELFAKLPRMSW
jgi:hypothetical protein